MPWGRTHPPALSFCAIGISLMRLLLAVPPPAHGQPAAESPDRVEVDREHEEAQGNHPEAQDGEKAEQAPDDQRHAQANAERAGFRHRHGEAAYRDPSTR